MLAQTETKLLQDFQKARAESDHLFHILSDEALYHRPIAERHRVIFYLGHLDGFDSIQICREGLGLKSLDPEFDALFQAGIDPDSNSLPTDKPTDWPSLSEIRSYADRCREHVDRNLERASEDVMLMALEHRLMHVETLAYMFHNFDYSTKNSGSVEESFVTSNPPPQEWCTIPEGEATLGRPVDGSFGWDNEFAEIKRKVEEFRIQRYSVTNDEYLRFVRAGAKAPHFWVQRGSEFRYRGMFKELPLPLDWPVYVTQAEAQAYASWIGKSLPTEEQFHRAAYGSPNGAERDYPWGNEEPVSTLGNFNFRRWDPEPIIASPGGDSAFGVSQLVGNGWQWTRSAFGPLPGFQPRSTYPGYSSNFFDGEHFVMKGGSARTASRLLRRSFRNWFRRDYPYMYATFRCVE